MSLGSGLTSKRRAKREHLTRSGVGKDLADLRDDLHRELTPVGALAVEEWTNPALADVNAVKVSFATLTTAQTFTGTTLDGVVGVAAMSPPRNLTVKTNDHAATWQGHVHVTGVDVNGNTIVEQFTLANNTTVVGVKAFARVTQVVVDAQVDALGLIEVGFGNLIGFARAIKSRAGLACLYLEIEAGVKVATGTVVAAATGLPNGTYLASNTPDGTRDYAVYYEYDATVNVRS
jgi:hypothetical protein